MSRVFTVKGYDKITGAKRIIRVNASTSKHARTLAYDQLTYPSIIGFGVSKSFEEKRDVLERILRG